MHWNFGPEIQVTTTSGDCHMPAIAIVDDLGDDSTWLTKCTTRAAASIGVVSATRRPPRRRGLRSARCPAQPSRSRRRRRSPWYVELTIYVAGVGPDGGSVQQIGVGTLAGIGAATLDVTPDHERPNVQAVQSSPAIAQDANGVVYRRLGEHGGQQHLRRGFLLGLGDIHHVVQDRHRRLSRRSRRRRAATVLHFVWDSVRRRERIRTSSTPRRPAAGRACR